MTAELKTTSGVALAGLFFGGAIAITAPGPVIGAIFAAGLALLTGPAAYWRANDADDGDKRIGSGH